MKRIKNILLIIAILCLPNKVFAASVGVNCPSSVTVGDTITCTVTGYHTSLSGLKAGVSYSGMDYVSAINLTGSNMFVVSNNTLDGAFDIANNSKSLASYVFKANNVGTASINITCNQIIDGVEFASVACTGGSKSITINAKSVVQTKPQTPTVTTPAAPKSTDASLKNIELSSGSIEFSSDKDTYDLTVDYSVSSIEIKGVSNDGKASVKIEGDTNLKEGDNVIKLVVTAEDGKTTKTYTLNIKRENKVLSKNSKIKKLTIDNYDINFNNNKKEYDLIISNEDSLTFNVELEDEFAKYEIVGNKKLKNKSVIKVIVTAEDKSSTVYSFNIIKEKNKTKELSTLLICSLVLNAIIIGLLIFIVVRLNKKDKKMLKELFKFKK